MNDRSHTHRMIPPPIARSLRFYQALSIAPLPLHHHCCCQRTLLSLLLLASAARNHTPEMLERKGSPPPMIRRRCLRLDVSKRSFRSMLHGVRQLRPADIAVHPHQPLSTL